nr:MAG TPA: hypothetical protein [Caudoviricetes sp.]
MSILDTWRHSPSPYPITGRGSGVECIVLSYSIWAMLLGTLTNPYC